ncbi:MAG: WxcM-like domain-containing protein [Bacillota bacterium]
MKREYEFIRIKPYSDARGILKKIITESRLPKDTHIEEVYLLYTNQGAVRGNHYHEKALEYFTVVSGTASIVLKDLETGVTEKVEITSGDNAVLKVPVRTIHSFKNEAEEPLIMLAISTREYDELDNDTYPMRILE